MHGQKFGLARAIKFELVISCMTHLVKRDKGSLMASMLTTLRKYVYTLRISGAATEPQRRVLFERAIRGGDCHSGSRQRGCVRRAEADARFPQGLHLLLWERRRSPLHREYVEEDVLALRDGE